MKIAQPCADFENIWYENRHEVRQILDDKNLLLSIIPILYTYRYVYAAIGSDNVNGHLYRSFASLQNNHLGSFTTVHLKCRDACSLWLIQSKLIFKQLRDMRVCIKSNKVFFLYSIYKSVIFSSNISRTIYDNLCLFNRSVNIDLVVVAIIILLWLYMTTGYGYIDETSKNVPFFVYYKSGAQA